MEGAIAPPAPPSPGYATGQFIEKHFRLGKLKMQDKEQEYHVSLSKLNLGHNLLDLSLPFWISRLKL